MPDENTTRAKDGTGAPDAKAPRPSDQGGTGDLWKLGLPITALVLLGFALAYLFVDPAPPARIVMATGEPGGAYARFGEAYRDRLAAFEIEIELLPSAGSRESLDRLAAEEVDVALVQSGVATEADREGAESLGSLYFEPLWVFHRKGLFAGGGDADPVAPSPKLSDFQGLRIAIGPEGSGTRAVALELLALNGVDGALLSMPTSASVAALRTGEVDVVFLISSADSELVADLLFDEAIEPFSFSRAAAYARTHRFLSRITLPEGMIDYARNIPSREVALVAPAANLVVSSELHPALVDLLIQSAAEIHGAGGVFEDPGAFPSAAFIDLPLNAEAQRFYEYGPPFLQRYLPFWLATLVDRLKVMLIPMIALLIPVFRLFPPLYRWRVRSRIYRWYTELREIDPRNRSDFDVEDAIARSQRIENEVAEVEAPASYGEELYQLRLHVEFVQGQLAERRARRLAGMPEDPAEKPDSVRATRA